MAYSLRRGMGRLWWWMRDAARDQYVERVKRLHPGIDPSVRFGYGTEVYGAGTITVGERTYFGNDCFVSCAPEKAKVTIGKCSAFAHNIHVRTSDFRRTPDFKDAFDAPSDHADIVIGDYCWIGSHVYICAGVTIGNNVIVGANAVVTHDLPDGVVAGGVPARVLHSKATYTPQVSK